MSRPPNGLAWRSFATVVVAALLLVAPSARAADVSVTRVDGGAVRGELLTVEPALVIRTAERLQTVRWQDVFQVDFGTDTTVAGPATTDAAWRFTLVDGTVVQAAIRDDPGSRLTVRLATPSVVVTLPLTAVRHVRRTELAATAAQRFAELVPDSETALDALILSKDGAPLTIRGACTAWSSSELRFLWNDRALPVPWDRVLGLLRADAPSRTAPFTVTLRNGDQVAGQIEGGSDSTLTIASRAFGAVELPLEEIARIEGRSERMVFVSALDELEYTFEPLFTKRWPLGRDAGLTGGPLQLGGRAFLRGLAMHSKATVRVPLDGQYERFVATVGMSDTVGTRGAALLRVTGDGTVLWEQVKRGGEPPTELTLDVTRMRELVLTTDYGPDLDLADRAVWALARLIRE